MSHKLELLKARHVIFASVISLAAAGAMADDITIDSTPSTSSVTRAQVKAEVLRARKAGELIAAGEGYPAAPLTGSSTLARSEVKQQIVAARAAGELLAAGEGSPGNDNLYASTSTLGRVDVKAQVLAARQAGELLPAGEGGPGDFAIHRHATSTSTPFQSLAKVFHRGSDTTSQ
jgi:hypothetical protein